MNTIWAFGDSFTFGHGCRENGPNSEYYYNYKKENDKIWVEWLEEYLNIPVKNLGVPGASNDIIIDSIIDNWDKILEKDYVLVGITWHDRFDVPFENRLQTIYFDWKNKGDKNLFFDEKLETILNFQYYFSNNELYKSRNTKRYNFLEKRLNEKNIKTYFWDTKSYVQSGNIETITTHTQNKIKDSHFSFNGHKQFSEIIYKKITNKMTLI